MMEKAGRYSRRTALGIIGVSGAVTAVGIAARSGTGDPTAPGIDPYYPGDARPGRGATVRRSPVGTSEVSRENTRAGAGGFTLLDRRFAEDRQGQIAGYASATSVEAGGSLDFHVSVAPAQRYRIQVYRVGHYAGTGARLVAASPWQDGRTQAAPAVHPKTRMVSCGWDPGWRLAVGRHWVSGLYLALATGADGWCQWIPFVVREPRRPTAGLVVLPTSTYQAYNRWPAVGHTGASLYYGFDDSGRWATGTRSLAVSHDRPYAGNGLPHHIRDEIGFVRWSERHGDDVSYATSEDLHTGRVDPARYRAVVFSGHDEYWSVPMRRAVATARDSGTSLVFLSSNNCYWRVRYGGSDARPDERIVDCAKVNPGPGQRPVRVTSQWRRAGSPEQQLIGAQYVSVVDDDAPLVVRESGHWFWAGTGVRDGDEIPHTVRQEADQVMPDVDLPQSTDRRVLADSPYRRLGVAQRQQSSLYRAPSGAWVFAAGTMGWTRALYADGFVDSRLRRATRNLLDRVLRLPE
ncbi:N,N-dimethylformamidase beta subunit family domain-containing protein [Plantactinospora sp. WMMC1484]|uniref:N,N-dimethylformamidase beta subunit family domain-containing protein n=1 Tax=Plantactinospora sp. WMMC1484 TaxID=3404122 RepID=UPI003BF6037A